MSDQPPLVSVIIPFYNPPPLFLRQAIESVLRQSYPTLEILLIDDGSGPESVAAASEYAEKYPQRVMLYRHPGCQNRGISSSRQLGVQKARGKYIAFLDADDVWLEHKLAEQVALLEAHPQAAMLYGNTLYWHSWSGKASDRHLDYLPKQNLQPDTLFQPPELLPRYLLGTTAVPCLCSILVRRQALDATGGFEEAFTGMYEDQVFYAKISLHAPIYVSSQCWDRYRQHSQSITAKTSQMGKERAARLVFLEWLAEYLVEKGVRDPNIWQALRQQIWLSRDPNVLPLSEAGKKAIRRLKKWLLKFQAWFLPAPVRRRIWAPEFKPD